MTSFALRAAALTIALVTPGCIIVAESDPPPPPAWIGTLTVEWSVAGSRDPAVCDSFAVDTMDLVVLDYYTGAFVAEVTPPCDAFGVSIDLDEGWYTAQASLLDFGALATDTQVLDSLEVLAGTELVVAVDFPSGTFIAIR